MIENGFSVKEAISKRYSVETIMEANDLALLLNTHVQAEFLLPRREETSNGIGLYVNLDKTESMF